MSYNTSKTCNIVHFLHLFPTKIVYSENRWWILSWNLELQFKLQSISIKDRIAIWFNEFYKMRLLRKIYFLILKMRFKSNCFVGQDEVKFVAWSKIFSHYTTVVASANENVKLIMNVYDTIHSCFVWLRLNNKCTFLSNT